MLFKRLTDSNRFCSQKNTRVAKTLRRSLPLLSNVCQVKKEIFNIYTNNSLSPMPTCIEIDLFLFVSLENDWSRR
jgi:hypothetical protein